MNNRFNIQELASLLFEQTGRDREETERFLKELVQVVSEEVCAGRQVKIKGLGTFKVVSVEKRESIHVNTGERFLIPEHYKFSFLPDKDLREQVNKPFSFFETTEINDNVDFAGMEISDEEKETEDESVEDIMSNKPEPCIDKQEEPASITNLAQEQDIEIKTDPDEEPLIKSESTLTVPKNEICQSLDRKRLYLGGTAIALVMISFMTLYIGKDYWFKAPIKECIAQSQDTVQEKIFTQDTLRMEEPVVKPLILDSLKISHGDRLTVIAQFYYGSKLFWVYIYEYNKATISDPNNVPIGTLIQIPSPDLYGIDANDRESREKAALLQTKILTGK